ISASGIEKAGWAVNIAGTDSSVMNTNGATISGNFGGIALADGGKIFNGVGSRIESLDSENKDCTEFENCAIYVESRYDDHGGPLVLTNAGRIVGNVQMDPDAANIVTLTSDGSIDGNLDIGTNTASTLTLNGGAGSSQLYSNAVTGTTTFNGTLIKNGSGTWVLDRDDLSSVTNTIINGGVLEPTVTLSGQVGINAGGTLDGVPGVAGNLSNAGVAAIHGGDAVVGGNYTQASTGTLAVSLGSKLDVAGTATLNGGTLEVTGADDGYVADAHTDVLTADGGVTGTFDKLVKDQGVVFTATTINYTDNSVWLDTTGLDVTTAAAGNGVHYTAASMGSAQRLQGAFEKLNAKLAGGSHDSVSSGFVRSAGEFQQSPNLRAAQASLESLSGQLHAASAGMTLKTIDATGRALTDRLETMTS